MKCTHPTLGILTILSFIAIGSVVHAVCQSEKDSSLSTHPLSDLTMLPAPTIEAAALTPFNLRPAHVYYVKVEDRPTIVMSADGKTPGTTSTKKYRVRFNPTPVLFHQFISDKDGIAAVCEWPDGSIQLTHGVRNITFADTPAPEILESI